MSDWLRGNYFFVMEDDHSIRPVGSMEEWCQWYEKAHCSIDWAGNAELYVSTIFLGLNRNWFGEGPPILFETMVFGGEYNELTFRYSTYDEAIAGHKDVCWRVFYKQGG
jgi:hypothetical protein